MKTKMKKILSIMICAVLLAGMLTALVGCEEEKSKHTDTHVICTNYAALQLVSGVMEIIP